MTPMRVLVTGSRTWTDAVLVKRRLFAAVQPRKDRPGIVVHGDAKGVDQIADDWAKAWAARGFDVTPEPHPADWSRGRSAGHARNAEMVALGADLCLAFIRRCEDPRCHDPESHGTHGASRCAEMAERAGIETRIYRWEEVMAS